MGSLPAYCAFFLSFSLSPFLQFPSLHLFFSSFILGGRGEDMAEDGQWRVEGTVLKCISFALFLSLSSVGSSIYGESSEDHRLARLFMVVHIRLLPIPSVPYRIDDLHKS